MLEKLSKKWRQNFVSDFCPPGIIEECFVLNFVIVLFFFSVEKKRFPVFPIFLFSKREVQRRMLMETRCCQKNFEFNDTRHQISVPLAVSANLHKKRSKLEKKTKKLIPGQMLGQDRAENNSAKRLSRSGEIQNPRQTSVDKPTTAERGALRGSDPPSGQCSQHGR